MPPRDDLDLSAPPRLRGELRAVDAPAQPFKVASMTIDPIARFHRWYARARAARILQPEAMALATADARGRPTVRMVLLKHADRDGFVFYTNGHSRKGRELRRNPCAALVFHWDVLGRQVRIEGPVAEVDAAEADAYWATRPR